MLWIHSVAYWRKWSRSMSYTAIGEQAYAFIFIIYTRIAILHPGLLIHEAVNATIGPTCVGYLTNSGQVDHRTEFTMSEKNAFKKNVRVRVKKKKYIYGKIGARECYSGMPRVNRKELWQQSLLAGTKSKSEKNANILQLLVRKEETLFLFILHGNSPFWRPVNNKSKRVGWHLTLLTI